MKIYEVKDRNKILINKLLEVWENSVKATHLFLSEEEIESIKTFVPQALENVEHLIIAENEDNIPISFMGIDSEKLEMLYIKDCERGKSLGTKLLSYGIKNYNVNKLIVNEQNQSAKGFYEHLGFKTYKRTELDEQGNPYPILYMKLEE